jgi:hypothetical protein
VRLCSVTEAFWWSVPGLMRSAATRARPGSPGRGVLRRSAGRSGQGWCCLRCRSASAWRRSGLISRCPQAGQSGPRGHRLHLYYLARYTRLYACARHLDGRHPRRGRDRAGLVRARQQHGHHAFCRCHLGRGPRRAGQHGQGFGTTLGIALVTVAMHAAGGSAAAGPAAIQGARVAAVLLALAGVAATLTALAWRTTSGPGAAALVREEVPRAFS